MLQNKKIQYRVLHRKILISIYGSYIQHPRRICCQSRWVGDCVDIACITETFLNDTVPSEVLDIPGYVIHRNDRKDGRRCGAVAVLVRQDVPCQRLTSLESADMETVWLIYRRPRMPRCLSHVVVGAVYNPPSADDKKMTTHILTCLETVTHDHPQAGLIVLGDFNRLRDVALISYSLKQVVKAPTRKASVLDKCSGLVLPASRAAQHRRSQDLNGMA